MVTTRSSSSVVSSPALFNISLCICHFARVLWCPELRSLTYHTPAPYFPSDKRENPNVPLGEVNVGLLADQVGVTTTNTLNLGQGDHDLLLAVNIGVEQTQDVLEVCLLVGHERYQITPSAFHPKIRHSTMKNSFSASSIFRFLFSFAVHSRLSGEA